jgi:flavin-dependent dehydrogenase
VPPSTQKLFDAIGVRDVIASAGFIRSAGNTVWWGADEARVEPFADGARGWQVPTHQLEHVLLSDAADAGVTIDRRPIVESDLATATLVIDATGRSGIVARAKHVREYDEGPRTVALVAEWQRADAWPVPDDSHTLVESYESGWAWSVPTGERRRHISVMVDPRRSGLARGVSARDSYRSEIEKTRVFRRLVRGAALDDGPWGWDASTYRARQYAGDGWLLAGDAGWFVDPLSSAGVKKALASGWLAAIVANTWIARPDMRSHARRFFSDRETDLERHFSTLSRSFLADAASSHPHAFWNDRADVDPASDSPDHTDGPEARAAYDALREAPALHVRRRDTLVIEPRPVISGREIVLEPHIITAGRPRGVRYLNDVNVVALVDLAPACGQVPDVVEAYRRTVGPAAFPSIVSALATAIARGWLVAE